MAKYILSKQVKGKKYLYTVKDENGNVVSTRTSARNYVACTADGSFYFGRLDLIGKGDHGKRLSHTAAILANPEKEYKKNGCVFYAGLPGTMENRKSRRTMDCPQY